MALPNPIPQALKSWLGTQVKQDLNPDLPAINQSLVSRVRWVLKALDTCFLPWTSQDQTQVLDYLVRRCELGDYLYRPMPCGTTVLTPPTGDPLTPTGILLQLLSFTGPTTINLLGSVVRGLNLDWAYSKPVRQQSLSGLPLPIDQRNMVLTSLVLTSPTSYQLTATDGLTPVQGTVTVAFSNQLLYGVGINLTVPDTLTAKPLQAIESRVQSFKVMAGPLEKVYCAFPLRLGANPLNLTQPQATYTVGAFNGGFLESIVSYINPAGYTEDYVLAESVNPNLGIIKVSVS